MKKSILLMMTLLCLGILVACGGVDEDNDNGTMDNNQQDTNTSLDDDTTNNTNDENDMNDDTNVNGSSDNDEDSTTMNDEKAEKMNDLGFAEFNLEVEYQDGKEFEAEIDMESNGAYEANLDDELSDNHLRGDEAFDYLYEALKEVKINKDSSKQEVVDNFLKAFELDSNYKNFDVDITFPDGIELEYEDKK